jgi:hypothetical protein
MSRKPVPPADEDGFLARWSRRKAEARREGADAEPPVSTEATAERESEPEPSRDPEAVRPPDLPDIDSLTAESDFKLFLKEGVPEELKTQALRRLWLLKPSLANLDGLVDYGEDLTGRSTVAAGLKSAYQAGRGYLDRLSDADAGRSEAESSAAGTAQADPDQAGTIDRPGPSGHGAGEGSPVEPAADADWDDHTTVSGKPRPLPRRS